MRHQKAGRKFGRNSSHRKAMMRNLVTSLFVHERVKTTDAKAKELKRVAERLVTKAVRLNQIASESPGDLSLEERSRLLAARRVASKHLRATATDKSENTIDVLGKLFHEIGPRFAERPGGYTRIIKLPNLRKGDNAPLSLVEFVDYDDIMEEQGESGSGGGEDKKGGLLSGLFKGKKKAKAEAKEDDYDDDDYEDEEDDEEEEKKDEKKKDKE